MTPRTRYSVNDIYFNPLGYYFQYHIVLVKSNSLTFIRIQPRLGAEQSILYQLISQYNVCFFFFFRSISSVVVENNISLKFVSRTADMFSFDDKKSTNKTICLVTKLLIPQKALSRAVVSIIYNNKSWNNSVSGSNVYTNNILYHRQLAHKSSDSKNDSERILIQSRLIWIS